MIKILKSFYSLILVLFIQTIFSTIAQAETVNLDLVQLARNESFHLFNRTAKEINEAGYKGVHVDEKEGAGVAYIKNLDFTTGLIELDIRGRNIPQQSFVGVAFHGVDGKIYDAIYFRPFNFNAKDPDKHRHSVQYISEPEFNWQKLRAEHTGLYEKSINSVVNPKKWFHVRIKISKTLIQVFVDNIKEPCLQVKPLNERSGGMIGLWVGHNSDGDFANLKITGDK